MKRIIVTGAAGFIGFHLSKRLLAEGENVIGVDSLNNYYDVQLKKDRLSQLSQNGSALRASGALKQAGGRWPYRQ
jgi:UDP-glucuronate 4-epimerase